MTSNVGFVAIGRNEGERAITCVKSALRDAADPSAVIYVDSGSTDGSPQQIASLGVTVVDLDTSAGFTAARARNAGLEKLRELHPDIAFVQFLDGDCELVEGWVATALDSLNADDKLAGVAGRRRERFPDQTVYNQLCDMEWNTPTGPADAVGGDAMFRVASLAEVDAYDPTMIAGEEPEMCIRLRVRGWTLARLDAEMTMHDAAMTRMKQWWSRNKRAGHAYAETLDRHPPTGRKEVRSNWLLGLFGPIFVGVVSAAAIVIALLGDVTVALVTVGVWLVLMTLYTGFQMMVRRRIVKYRQSRGDDAKHANTYATWVLRGKLPQAMGQLKYRLNKARGKRSGIIEYK